ncbi:MAG: transcriptional regulator with XRE-family HTH domain [Candidatus Azotimanducaceae bacterium]
MTIINNIDDTQHSDYSLIDKRDIAESFRERMVLLIAKHGYNLSQFAKLVGVDRSALSQFLMKDAVRLPRAETLFNIAQHCGVSIDWLLGKVSGESNRDDTIPLIETLRMSGDEAQRKLDVWQREARGYKIRYIPSTLPDLLRIPEVSDFEFKGQDLAIRAAQDKQAREQLLKTPYPETDIEVCMPYQTLEHLGQGQGIWKDLPQSVRIRQLEHMHKLVDEFYPTFRLFLYDGHQAFSSPLTIFGPIQAAVYMGNMYLVVHSIEHVRALTSHFDRLIRKATVTPEKTADFIENILHNVSR